MKDAIVAGILSGLISPLVLAWLSHQIIWKSQKRNEMQMNALTDTLTALSLLETDAMDIDLQSGKKEFRGSRRVVEYHPETIVAMGRATGMVKTFFSHEVFNKVDRAFKTKISLENIPNEEFYENRTTAIVAMKNEIGLNRANYSKAITRIFSGSRGAHAR